MTDPQHPKLDVPGSAVPNPDHIHADIHPGDAGSVQAHTPSSGQLNSEQLRNAAAAQAGKVADRAKHFASRRKDAAAEQIVNVSSVIDRVANELEHDQSTAEIAGYVHDLAAGGRRLSDNVRNKSVDEIVTMIQDFGRRQPVAFLGASALVGFLASRMVMASSKRQPDNMDGGMLQ
jgi:hypothetical protein